MTNEQMRRDVFKAYSECLAKGGTPNEIADRLIASLRAPVERQTHQRLNVERGPKAIPVERQAPELRTLSDNELLNAICETNLAQQSKCGYPSPQSLLELARAIEGVLIYGAPSAPGREG